MGLALDAAPIAKSPFDVERIDPIVVHVVDVRQESTESFRRSLELLKLGVLSHFGFELGDLALLLRDA